jgi:hypothetical protein
MNWLAESYLVRHGWEKLIGSEWQSLWVQGEYKIICHRESDGDLKCWDVFKNNVLVCQNVAFTAAISRTRAN